MWQCWLKNVCGMGEIRLLTNDLRWSLSQDITGFPALTSSQSCECVNMFLCWPSVLVRFSFEILRSCVTSERVLISKFCYSSNERSDSKPPSFVVLHRNSGQLLFCVQVEDPEELCLCVCVCVSALVYTSVAMKHFFPSHATPLSQPLSHSLVLFSKDFSVARACDPAVFPSRARSQTHTPFFINISLLLSALLFPLSAMFYLPVSYSGTVSFSPTLSVSTPPIPAWHTVSKLVCKYLS